MALKPIMGSRYVVMLKPILFFIGNEMKSLMCWTEGIIVISNVNFNVVGIISSCYQILISKSVYRTNTYIRVGSNLATNMRQLWDQNMWWNYIEIDYFQTWKEYCFLYFYMNSRLFWWHNVSIWLISLSIFLGCKNHSLIICCLFQYWIWSEKTRNVWGHDVPWTKNTW